MYPDTSNSINASSARVNASNSALITSQTNQPRPPLELPDAMQELNSAIDNLEQLLKTARVRFEPVLRPVAPSELSPVAPCDGRVPRFGSPLASAISEQAGKLQRMDVSLQEILDRAQI